MQTAIQNTNAIISGYTVRMECNCFHDGAAIVLYNMRRSDISVVRNTFTDCTADPIAVAKNSDILAMGENPLVKLSIFQNMFESGLAGDNIVLHLLSADVKRTKVNIARAYPPVSDFCFMLNYCPGFTINEQENLPTLQKRISGNLFGTKDGEICGN